MTDKRIRQFNQQRKRETFQESGILERAAVRSVLEAEEQSTNDLAAQPLGNSALSKDFSRVPISTTKPQQIMTKLMIGPVGDKYEQEADRAAKQVVQRMNAPASVQSGEDETVQPEEMETKDNEARLMRSPILQRRSSDGGMAATPDLESSINQLRGSGQPLAKNIRKPMEQAFGADFSGVKIHTNAQSNWLNQSIQAKAFTTGKDVFFQQGEYNPRSRGGQELIAHELTHVVQQNGETVQRQPQETIQRMYHSTLLGINDTRNQKTAAEKFEGVKLYISQQKDPNQLREEVLTEFITKLHLSRDFTAEEVFNKIIHITRKQTYAGNSNDPIAAIKSGVWSCISLSSLMKRVIEKANTEQGNPNRHQCRTEETKPIKITRPGIKPDMNIFSEGNVVTHDANGREIGENRSAFDCHVVAKIDGITFDLLMGKYGTVADDLYPYMVSDTGEVTIDGVRYRHEKTGGNIGPVPRRTLMPL